MNARVRLGVFWGVILSGVILVITGLLKIFNTHNRFSGSPGGYAAQGRGFQGRGFRHHQFMYGHPYHHGFQGIGFLIFLLIGLAVLFFLMKRFRKNRTEASTMEHFIDASVTSAHAPIVNHNGAILDQWEQTINNQKENK